MDLRKNKWLLGEVGGVVLLCLLFLVFDYLPKLKEAKDLKVQILSAKQSVKVDSEEEKQKKRAELKEQIDQIKNGMDVFSAKLEEMKVHVSEDKNVPLVILGIEDMAAAANVELISVKPLESVIEHGYEVLPIEIRLQAKYRDLIKLLKKIEMSPQMSAVTDLTVEIKKDLYPLLDVKLVPLVVFAIKDTMVTETGTTEKMGTK